jgi:D-sedoheptulose 7-phosphate isomerase
VTDLAMVKQQVQASLEAKQNLLQDENLLAQIQQACDLLVDRYRQGNKLLLAGNGGSAADAQHIAAELVCRFYVDRPGLPALALTTDTSILTAAGNDYGYDHIFERQVEAQGREGDVFLGISTSGNSANVLKALNKAQDMGLATMGLTGQKGGAIAELCDICLCVPSTDTPRIQECHILLGHILCHAVEQASLAEGWGT